MLKRISRLFSGRLHSKTDNVKPNLPKVNARDVYAIYLKPDAFERICQLQGWANPRVKKDGRYSRFGERLLCSRQYSTGMAKGKFSCERFIPQIVLLAQGRFDGNWAALFDIRVKLWGVHPNHPALNEAKYQGQIPYEKYSYAAIFRGQDYAVESR